MDGFEQVQERARFQRELERLQNECQDFEEKAGLSQTMERARVGRFIPLGAFGGEKPSCQEYIADEHDYLRGKTRNAYFSVQSIELRRKLITAQRLIESHIRQSLEKEIISANREVSIAAGKVQSQPWGKAALGGISAVAFGYWVFWIVGTAIGGAVGSAVSGFGIVGAIGGAVAGFFLGQGVIAEARNEATAELAQASQELEQSQEEKLELSLMPEFFSHREEIRGERDTGLDSESAYANVLQAHKAG